MKRRLTVDFYRVRMPGSVPTAFEPCLYGVAKSPRDKFRNLVISGDPTRLHHADKWGECCEGEMTRIRMDDLPVKANLSGAIEAFNFDDDEGIGEQTAFLYHPGTQVLLLQRSKAGVSPRAFAFYFGEKSGIHEPIALDPVLRSDAVQRLASLGRLTKVSVRVARVNNPKVFEDQGFSLAGMVRLLEDFSAPSLSFTVSMGRKQGSLAIGAAKNTAMWLLGRANSEDNKVTKIEIAGRTDEDERDELDLIEERMIERELVETDSNRRVPYATRQATLRSAFARRTEELRQMFK